VRVRATGYDRTVPAGTGAITFLDLPANAGTVTVTIAGTGTVSVGTLLIGRVTTLGLTEASPTAGITDFSRKDVDEFGDVTIVQRAWAKRMTASALIRTDAVDMVANRIAAVRAQPSLWIGQTGLDSLTVYGFFKDFSIEVGETVSKLALSIEGLSAAVTLTPIGGEGSVAWPDVTDPTGTKPADNADVTGNNTSKDTNAVAGTPSTQVIAAAAALKARTDALENQTIPAINTAAAAADIRITAAKTAADAAKARADGAFVEISTRVTQVNTRIDNIESSGGYDDTSVRAEVDRVDTAAIGRDAALGQSIQSVSASITTTDRDLRALVTTKEQAAVGREDAISQRITDLIAEGGGGSEGVDSVARSEVSRVEQASVGRDEALGTRIETVQASFTSGGGNLLVGTDFITLDGWTYNQYNPSGTLSAPNRGIDVAGSSYHPLGEHTLGMYQPGRVGDSTYLEWLSDPFAVTPGGYLQFSAFCLAHRASVKIALVWLNAAGAAMFAVDAGDVSTPEALGNNPENYTQHGIKSVQVPSNAVGAYLIMRKNDTKAGANPNDSYAWFWRPSVSIARAGQVAWAPYSPGSGRAAQIASTARIKDTTDALARADLALGSRSTSLEAQMSRQAPSALNTFTDDVNNRLTRIDEFVNARINDTDDVLADLPNRYATAQRTTTLEAQLRQEVASPLNDAVNYINGRVDTTNTELSARIEERSTAIADAKAGAVAQTVSQLRADYNGTAAIVTQQAGSLVDLRGRTAAYWRTTAVAGNNRAQITISADANAGAGVDIIGDVSISGNLLVSGSVVTDRIAPNAVSSIGAAIMGGGVAAQDGPFQTDLFFVGSTGAPLAVDIQFDAYRSDGGTGLLRAVLFQRSANGDIGLREVRLRNPSTNVGGPTNFWVLTSAPAGSVGFYLSFEVVSGGGQILGAFNVSSIGLRVTEFKR